VDRRLKPSEEIDSYISFLGGDVDLLLEQSPNGLHDPINALFGRVASWLKKDLRATTLKLYGYKSEAFLNFWRGDVTLDQILDFIKQSPADISSVEKLIEGLRHLESVAKNSEAHYIDQETIDRQRFKYKGFKIEAFNISKETTSAMLKAIDCLVDIFKKRGVIPVMHKAIDRVYLQHNPSNEEGAGWGKNHAYYVNKKVFLYDTILDVDREMPEVDTICYVLIHEIGHWLHFDYLPREAHVLWNSSWDGVMRGRRELPFEEAQNNDTLSKLNIPTSYGKRNPNEDFAETFARFMVNPNSISTEAKERLKATLSLSAGFGRRFMRLGSIIGQLEERVALLEKRVSMSRTASIQKIAGKAYLFDEGLTKRKVELGEGAMLYKIDKAKNQSKYYEMLITPIRDKHGLPKFELKKQHGRLGPSGRQIVKVFDTLREAKQALAVTLASKTSRGYISTYDRAKHKTVGGQLKQGQYPIGLASSGGSWKNEGVNSQTRKLRNLVGKINDSLELLEEGTMPKTVLRHLERINASISDFDSSLTGEIRKRLRPPMERLRGTNKRFIQCPKKTVSELKTLRNYLRTQLSVVS